MAAPHPMRTDLIAEHVRSILDYDPETGVFTWKTRPASMFRDGRKSAEHEASIWNAKWAGSTAGTLQKGYCRISVHARRHSAHRLAWLLVHGEWPDGDVDHIDGNRLNNRIANLRLATRSQNLANARKSNRNTSGLKGVSWNKKSQRWMAQICADNHRLYLGLFDTPEEAHAAYLAAAHEHFGTFAHGGSHGCQ